ncbi:hypothetical protein L1887_00980 [Cichorium endivia]|nr:hypothetical protein L1887_00980 [Cichorium endivia]
MVLPIPWCFLGYLGDVSLHLRLNTGEKVWIPSHRLKPDYMQNLCILHFCHHIRTWRKTPQVNSEQEQTQVLRPKGQLLIYLRDAFQISTSKFSNEIYHFLAEHINSNTLQSNLRVCLSISHFIFSDLRICNYR